MKELFQKEIDSTFSYSLDLPEAGFYSLTIKASVKPGWRNKWRLSFKGIISQITNLRLDDEDLRVKIDALNFPKLGGKRNLFDSPAAFSGTRTLGRIKTVIFLMDLKEGPHTVNFIPEHSAYLESIEVERIPNHERVEFHLETRADDENYYSWYTLTLVSQALRSLAISTSAGILPNGTDDDDLKVAINGSLRKNPPNRHRDSLFCGFTLKGKKHTFSEELNLQMGLHYIELIADKMPILNSVKLNLSPYHPPLPATGILLYRVGPNGENYNRFDRAIKEEVDRWNDHFFSQESAPPKPLDPNLVKAMIYVESLMGYGYGKSYPAYPDVMQVGNPDDPAIHTLRNDSWIDPGTGGVAKEYEWDNGREKVLEYKGAKVENATESIYWGVRWLYHKAQYIEGGKRLWYSWEQAVKRYNSGGDPKYFDKIIGIYRDGRALTGIKLWLLIGFVILSSFAVAHDLYSKQGQFFITEEPLVEGGFQFSVNALSGIRLIRYPVSRYFFDGRDLSTFYNPDVGIWYLGARPSGVEIIAVAGRDISGYEIVKILEYDGHGFSIRRKIGEDESLKEGFDGNRVLIGGRLGDEEQEISEWYYLDYKGAPDQLREDTYYFDEWAGIYRLRQQKRKTLSYEL